MNGYIIRYAVGDERLHVWTGRTWHPASCANALVRAKVYKTKDEAQAQVDAHRRVWGDYASVQEV